MIDKSIYNYPVELQKYSVGYKVVRTDTSDVLGVVSDKYSLIKHEDVINSAIQQLKESGEKAKIHSVNMFGKYQSCMKVKIVLNEGIDFKGFTSVGEMKLMLNIVNSYNGLYKLSYSYGIFRLVCSNGMVQPVKTNIITAKHMGEMRGLYAKLIEMKDSTVSIFNKSFQALRKAKPIDERVLVTKTEYEEMLDRNMFKNYMSELGKNAYSEYQAYTDYISNTLSGDKQSSYEAKILPAMLKQIEE